MRIEETLRTAITALKTNKIRSFLTMLGVIIGVFAVVALVAMVQGFKNYITDQFSALGSNLILVSPGSQEIEDPGTRFSTNKLELKHIDIIKNAVANKIEGLSPSLRVGKTIEYRTSDYFSTLVGGNYETEIIFNVTLDKGRFYTKNEDESGARVAVIGATLVTELFGTKNPLNETIKIDGHSFKVIGIAAKKGPNFDDRVFIPMKTAEDTLGVTLYSSIAMKARDGVDIDQTMREVQIALLKDLKEDEFSVLSQRDILDSIQSILNVISIGVGTIAGISLLVGGIGIMNIMLVSVTERIREIGLRKALGATAFNIAFQFMLESILLSVIGGSIGLFLGYLVTIPVQQFVRAEVPLWTVGLALGFSIAVGVVFGTYPAVNAAKKDPIEALRYE